jgi:hypothetical protein
VFAWHVPRSGTRFSAILEWALAAQWWRLDWDKFCDLDGIDQSFLVAVYRTAKQIEAVEAWQQNKKK